LPWASISWPYRPEMHNPDYTKSMFETLKFNSGELMYKE